MKEETGKAIFFGSHNFDSFFLCILKIRLSFTTGEFTVTVELSTQITRVVQEVAINVAPEGSLFHRHTSVLLDLKARANVLR